MELTALRCASCRALAVPPAFVCAKCSGERLEPAPLSGRGRVISWTTIYAPPAGFEDEAPYDVALIALDEGLRITGRLRRGTVIDFDAPVRLVDVANGCFTFDGENEK